jgi:CRP/FNR family transcriptional regulator
MDLTLLLKNCRMFADLDHRDLETIQGIALRRDYRKGQTIFNEGDPTRAFYLVVSGAVKLARIMPDGRERVLHVVEAGDTFAEAAIFMTEYPAAAEALVSTTTVIQVDKNGFRQLLASNQKLTFKIFGAMAKWLRELRDTITDLTMKEVPGRFASYVLSLPSETGKPIKVGISKTTIAQMLATTKETFSRLLNRLAEQKILTYRGNQIKILDRNRLQRIADGEERV